jgi:hypothetical protein
VPVLAPTLMAGTRFWAFDLFRSSISTYNLPPFLAGGSSGAFGGIAEVFAHALVTRRQLPALGAVGNQAGKLFLCFGTYTWLSTKLSTEQPPKPFVWCWTLGAIAGGFGTGVTALVEGMMRQTTNAPTQYADVLRQAGKGSVIVGTVIAVQVTSAAKVIKGWDETSSKLGI